MIPAEKPARFHIALKRTSIAVDLDSEGTVYHAPTGKVIGSIKLADDANLNAHHRLDNEHVIHRMVQNQIKSHGAQAFLDALYQDK